MHHGIMKDFRFKNGECIIIKNKRFYFEGIMELKGEKLIGIGKQIHNNRNYYEGEVEDYIENGWGIFRRNDSYTFKGHKVNKAYEGYCEIYYPDSNIFLGKFAKNKRHGLGVSYINDKSTVSLGKYENDIKDGGHLTITDSVWKFDLFIKGIEAKTIINKKMIEKYIFTYYPEFEWLLSVNFTNILEIFRGIKSELT
jgi:hypothetical protein